MRLLLIFLTIINLNADWRFEFGHAADPVKDFGCGTEYFNYLTKANSIHNEGPYVPTFNDSAWQVVNVPHDWATTLPHAPQASHSHGYQCIGYAYPENSVGWYRKHVNLDTVDYTQPYQLVFEGIFRDARVWVNGFYVGHSESGYLSQIYTVTDYLRQGDNLICVRVDASLQEGWFYEGAGIYRNVYMAIGDRRQATGDRRQAIGDRQQATGDRQQAIGDRQQATGNRRQATGNSSTPLRGVCLHQDHGGVGIAVTKGLMEYRLRKLMDLGVNAIRTAHHPAAPDLLDLCDSLGLYVIEENRLMGASEQDYQALKQMIERDKHHPSIIMWSIGNEEWALEWNETGERIARTMTQWCHELDPTRPVTVATSSGPNVVWGVDVAGFNYMKQNNLAAFHDSFPDRWAVMTEETTGCGTRGVATYNDAIEQGWKNVLANDWIRGIFYWTGFDYKGEPNPAQWPSVSSLFGVLDLCGFPKDEAYYLQSVWTDEPVLHILPHWNLEGQEGDSVQVWVYSNMDEVELRVNGKRLSRQTMPKNGHLVWNTIYQPGSVEAIGYKNGRIAKREKVYTAGSATQVMFDTVTYSGTTIMDITLLDKKGHFCPTACDSVQVEWSTPVRILGYHNGNPTAHLQMLDTKHQTLNTITIPTFNGHAQIIYETPSFSAAVFQRSDPSAQRSCSVRGLTARLVR